MIEDALKSKFERIFDLKKTTFNAPSESQEQECLFIEIDNVISDVKDNLMKAKVTGKASVFGQAEKMPVSYFSQKIRQAANDLTKDLFFYEFEATQALEVNIVKRGFSFVFFFTGQYNPHADNIESIQITGA